MPNPLLDPRYDLSQRIKTVENQLLALATSQAPYVEAGPAPYYSGAWMVAPGGATTATTGAALHVAEWFPFYVPAQTIVQAVSVNVTTASANVNLRLAFYTSSFATFNLGAEFGVVPCAATGVQTLTGQWSVPKGWMWVTAKAEGSGALPAFTRTASYVPPFPILGATTNQLGASVYGHISADLSTTDAYGNVIDSPFPATLTPAGVLTSPPLMLGIQVQ